VIIELEEHMQTGIERWTGLVLVGDGMAGLIWPREYLRKLKVGPKPLNDLLEAFAERPTLTRVLCVAEIALGLWTFALRKTHHETITKG
jgi:hypothetical protein